MFTNQASTLEQFQFNNLESPLEITAENNEDNESEISALESNQIPIPMENSNPTSNNQGNVPTQRPIYFVEESQLLKLKGWCEACRCIANVVQIRSKRELVHELVLKCTNPNHSGEQPTWLNSSEMENNKFFVNFCIAAIVVELNKNSQDTQNVAYESTQNNTLEIHGTEKHQNKRKANIPNNPRKRKKNFIEDEEDIFVVPDGSVDNISPTRVESEWDIELAPQSWNVQTQNLPKKRPVKKRKFD